MQSRIIQDPFALSSGVPLANQSPSSPANTQSLPPQAQVRRHEPPPPALNPLSALPPANLHNTANTSPNTHQTSQAIQPQPQPRAIGAAKLQRGGPPPMTMEGGSSFGVQNHKIVDSTEQFPWPGVLLPNQTVGAIRQYYTKINPLPPSEVCDYVTVDEGNCSSRYMRCSMYNFPSTKEGSTQPKLPLGLVVSPLADPVIGETPVPLVDLGKEPTRCIRCHAYHNALNKYVNGGRNFICYICQHVNDVSDDAYLPIDENGYPSRLTYRPELTSGSVEYVVNANYVIPSKDSVPGLVFVIDATQNSVDSGIIKLFAESLRTIMKTVGEVHQGNIGFITFGTTVHYYNFNENLRKPQMLVVSDLNPISAPIKRYDGNLLVNYKNPANAKLIDDFLENLPNIFVQSQEALSCFATAVKAGALLLKASGGKLIVLSTLLGTVGPGLLNSRWKHDPLVDSTHEMDYLQPQSDYFHHMANDINSHGITVNLFLFSRSHLLSYFDVATIAPLYRTTGGQLFYYDGFIYQRDRSRFHHELFRTLTKTTGYQCLLRVRTSLGIEISDSPNLRKTENNEFQIAAIHTDSTYPIYLKLTENLKEQNYVGFQSVLLYTNIQGQRRLRIHSLQIPTADTTSKVFASVDLDCVVYLQTSLLLRQSMKMNVIHLRKFVFDHVIDVVHAFRVHCTNRQYDPAILVLPDALKLYPVYMLSLLKSTALKPTFVCVDVRVAERFNISSTPIKQLLLSLYPRMFALHDLPENTGIPDQFQRIVLPKWERLLISTLTPKGCFLLEGRKEIWIWVGRETPQEFLYNIFGVTSLLSANDLSLNSSNHPTLIRIKNIITELRRQQASSPILRIVKQGSDEAAYFVHKMVEDRVEETMSHRELLAMIHLEVNQRESK